MRKVIRLMSLFLTLVMIVTLFCACGEEPSASKEPAPSSGGEKSASSETAGGAYTLTKGIGENEKIPFGDPKLEAAIRKELKLEEGRDITPKDCLYMIYLDIRGLGISNLDGLQYCRYLEVLYAGDNKISCLDAIAELPELFALDLSDNELTDFGAIVGLENLMFLDLHGNHMTDTPSPYVYFDEDKTYIATSGQTVEWN